MLGDRYSLRWFVLGTMIAALLFWTAWHFYMESPAGPRQLLALVAGGAVAGLLLWLSYR